MTREQVNQILRQMEHIREMSYEAESDREEKQLTAEYGSLWKTIEPYVKGTIPYMK